MMRCLKNHGPHNNYNGSLDLENTQDLSLTRRTSLCFMYRPDRKKRGNGVRIPKMKCARNAAEAWFAITPLTSHRQCCCCLLLHQHQTPQHYTDVVHCFDCIPVGVNIHRTDATKGPLASRRLDPQQWSIIVFEDDAERVLHIKHTTSPLSKLCLVMQSMGLRARRVQIVGLRNGGFEPKRRRFQCTLPGTPPWRPLLLPSRQPLQRYAR